MSVTDELKGMTEIALFAGAGGGVLGSKMLGIRTVAYVEWDAFPQAILKARMADGLLEDAPVFGDVREFDITPYAGKTDIVSGGFPCFVAGTMILTRDGYRAIEEIQAGDLVLTHMGRWRRVNSVMFKHNAPLREIHAQGVPGVVCSDNHPFHARSSKKTWDRENRTYRRAFTDPVRTEARDITREHFLGQVLPPIQDDDKTEAFWGLVGRYLADGCRNFANNAIVISGSSTEGEDISRMVSAAKYSPSLYTVDTGTQVILYNQDFFDFLEPFGRYSHGKHIPGWALQLPAHKAKALLEGYLSGDGHRTEMGWEANTVSKALALSLSLLAQRAYGVISSIRLVRKEPTTKIMGRTVNQRDYYAVRIPNVNRSAFIEGDYGWKKVKRNDPKGFGDVYNIAVDEDHTYVADGAVVLNCQPFSTAGRQEADFDPRNMWPATRDIIRGVRPKYAYLENVAGLLTGTHGYFGVVLGELARSGYDVAWTCLPAAAVGAPHRRDRLWVLGRRRDGNQSIVPEGTLTEFARFDDDSKAWCRFDGRCRADTTSTVSSYIPFPRSGTVAIAPDGTTTVYALDPVALADGKTRSGWPWPRILKDLRIPDPAASVKDAPVATDVEMMPTPNAFDAHAVGASRSASRPEWGRHGVSLHHLAAEWSAREGRTFPTPLAGNATPGEGGNHGGMALRAAAAEGDGERTWPTPTVRDMKGASQSFVETGLRTGHYSGLDGAVIGAEIEEAAEEEGMDALEMFREWPTPTASNNRKSKRALTASSDNGRRSGGGQSSPPALEQAVELAEGIVPKELEGVDPDDLPPATRAMWPTPQASRVSNDVTVRTASQRSADSPPNKLGWAVGEAEDSLETWLTPSAADPGLDDVFGFDQTEETTPMDLDDIVDLSADDTPLPWHIINPTVNVREGQFPTPAAADSFCNAADGFSPLGRFIQNDGKRPPRRSKEERETARANRGPVGQLNPDWVEWLMGWPVGWTSMSPMSHDEAEAYATAMPGPWWRLEPLHIPRITVGTVDRTGRLKACGNGQVSLANAAAFEILLETFRQIEVACAHGGPGEVDALDILGL